MPRVVIPQIAWHARDPVLTIDFDPKGKSEQGYYRLATGGADRLLLIWHLSNPSNLSPEIIPVAELTRHQKGINVVRFSPCGNFIASGDDDSYVFIWKNESISEKEEVWNVEKIFRRHVEDVSDLCWSPDSNFLVSGSVDNTAVLWDVKKGTPLHFWSEREHTGFVQGVAYDPLGQFSATMCIDRSLRFFNNNNGKLMNRTLKYPPAWIGINDSKDNVAVSSSQNQEVVQKVVEEPPLPPVPSSSQPEQSGGAVQEDCKEKPLSEINAELDDEPTLLPIPPKRPVITLNRLFHDDSLKTFCRRISCSPRGELMMVPGGLLPPVEKGKENDSRQSTPVGDEDELSKDKEKAPKRFDSEQNNAVIIFCRNSWSNPCAVIPTGMSYSIAAKFNPVYYQRERQPFEYDPAFVNSNKKNERTISCVGKLRPTKPEQEMLLDMPYRLVYAVATNDSLLIGDTASAEPLACIKNIHCTRMTDISWSPDGLVLIASSTDGFCSILTFEEGELGAKFKVEEGAEFPALTPNCFPVAPPEPKPVKKKEPKEPKEPKANEPKEKKEPKDKKEKKNKEKKTKVLGTPTPGDEKKKSTLLEMFSSAKNSPVAKTDARKQSRRVELVTLNKDGEPIANETVVVDGIAVEETKKNKEKEPKEKKTKELGTPTPGEEKKKSTLLEMFRSAKTSPVAKPDSRKQPRRVEFITLNKDGQPKANEKVVDEIAVEETLKNKEETTKENELGTPCGKKEEHKKSTLLEMFSSAKNSPVSKTESRKQPRRVDFVTLNKDGEPKANVKVVDEIAVEETKKKNEKELKENKTKENELGTPGGNKEEMKKSTLLEMFSSTKNSPVAKPESRKQPRRVELVTLNEDGEPKAKRRVVDEIAVEETKKNDNSVSDGTEVEVVTL